VVFELGCAARSFETWIERRLVRPDHGDASYRVMAMGRSDHGRRSAHVHYDPANRPVARRRITVYFVASPEVDRLGRHGGVTRTNHGTIGENQ
jgi:hypothetical protein